MTLLGAGFQMGTTSTVSSEPMDLPLDELIKARAKAAKPTSTNADRSAGTRQANKDAKMNARRGRSESAKPTAMQVEAAVTKQVNQTAIKRAAKMAKEKPISTTASLQEKVARRRQKRDVMAAGARAVVAESGGSSGNANNPSQPTKNALKAARAALTTAGYTFPPNCVIKVISAGGAKATATSDPPGNRYNETSNTNGHHQRQQQQQQQQQQPKANNSRRRAGGKA